MYFQIITSIDDSPLDYLFSNIMILVIKFKYLNEKENEWKTSYSGYAKKHDLDFDDILAIIV